MKTYKIIMVLFLVFSFSCKNLDKNSEITVDSKNDLKKVSFRDITELEKYKGFEKLSGQVLPNSNKVLAYLQNDSLKILVLEKIIRNSSPQLNYSILDEVAFISNDSKSYLALTSCELNENAKNEIIFSLVKDEDTEYFEKILKTWIIDLNTDTFKEIESNKVKCYNEFYGYDG